MDKAYHARLMRNLDEPQRNALIAQADNVIDLRDRFEKRMVPASVVDCPYMDPEDLD